MYSYTRCGLISHIPHLRDIPLDHSFNVVTDIATANL